MSNIFYGIRRLLLLNTDSYSIGDFPLDRPLSISAPNNRGKSTAINALQFPFLSNMNDMSFPRSNEDTRKYYFPYDNSYVVSEIVTEAGTYIVGAAGKGQASGYEYQLFAYQSKLDIGDFLFGDGETDEKQVRNYKELVAHLARRDVWVKSLHPKQMRDVLMGKIITLKNNEKFTIGVFRLRSMTDKNYRLFIRVFKNLLHMNTVNLDEMKCLLIDVLLPGEGSTAVDFMARYRILNEEVERAKSRADTAINIAPDVKKLIEANAARDEAYGILRALFPLITIAYETDRNQREREIKDIEHQISSIEPQMRELKNSQTPLQDLIEQLAIEENRLDTQLIALEKGEARFALHGSVDQIQQEIGKMQAEAEHLVGELHRAHPEDIEGIRADLKAINQQAEDLTTRMSAIHNNLLFVLTEHFGESQIQTIAKLLNRNFLSSVPIGKDSVTVLDEKQLFEHISEALSNCKSGYYDDGRVKVNLEKIPSIDIDDYFNYDTIQENLGRLDNRRTDLARNLEVARDYKEMEKTKKDLLAKIKKEECNLAEYQEFLVAKKEKEKLKATHAEVTSDLEAKREDLGGITGKSLKLGEAKQSLVASKVAKETGLVSLVSKYAQVVPISSAEPMGTEPSHRLPSALEDMIDTYLLALEDRRSTRDQIEQRLAIIEGKSGLRFTTGKDEGTTIRELVEAVEGINEYIKHQDNCQKAVSQEIGALLKGLTDRFDAFVLEIGRFNRQMNSRKISNIDRIKFVVDDKNDILRTVKEIVGQDSIFSDPESVHRAIKQLDDLVSRKNVNLSLENMFNIGIEVELEGGKVTGSFNDGNTQSTGTALTIKVILNVMLLNRLLFIKDGQIVNIPIYIDEAGQIDQANQQTLIDQCLPAGFVPVFASVEAQATADYWIGLNEVGGRIYVDQENWFRLSKIEKTSEGLADA
ncbi:MAG: hypothetical protein RPU34_05300 [Candidatus Sedimenticola sp. (ex Thyasira tokunagai)]